MRVTGESLAYWYLRLNGCLTIRNFIVHPEWRRDGVGTDADIVGIRFPHRQEMMRRPLVDDEWFGAYDRHLLLVIAEVKTGQCHLNGPWTTAERRNVQKVLAAIGVYPKVKLDGVAAGLYRDGFHEDGDDVAALVAFGSTENGELRERYPRVRQVLWPQVKRFIHQRFADYLREKAWHQTWDEVGESLYALVERERDVERFCQLVEVSARG
jgi:hypothetical protein